MNSGRSPALPDPAGGAKVDPAISQTQKLEAIGLLAGAVAHDFNNLLTAMTGYAELARNGLNSEQHEVRGLLDNVLKAGKSAAALTNKLLAFARKQVLQPQVVDLNAVVRGVEDLLQRLLGEELDLIVLRPDQPAVIEADPGQLEQVLLNLVLNAREAMPDGGELKVEVILGEPAEAVLARRPERDPGDWALLRVSDTGCGIPPEILPRIFEPFFTTKTAERGTGLGLSTVHGIVKQSEGELTVRSTPGAGTVVEVALPLASHGLTPGEEDEGQDAIIPGRASILVVEDDPLVSDIVTESLRSAGYTTVHASDGLEALRAYERDGTRFELLLTDVVMPRMGGPELAGTLLRWQPELKVLFMSGHDDASLAKHGMLRRNGFHFLPKPFTPSELTRRVHRVLASHNTPATARLRPGARSSR